MMKDVRILLVGERKLCCFSIILHQFGNMS